MNDGITNYDKREINESAIRSYALECSKRFRAGKFKRVGSEFIEEVKVDVEALVRVFRAKYSAGMHPPLHITTGECPPFATGNLMSKIEAEVNEAIARLVQGKVQAQPSCGQTLGRTR